ncbi:MAG: AIM24 family protein [Merdibacter sp.]
MAWDASLDYSIRVASGTFGFTSGEGLVNEFNGNGKVYIQTRNIHNLADACVRSSPAAVIPKKQRRAHARPCFSLY